MMYGILVVLALLVLVLFFVNDKKIKRASLCLGLTAAAVVVFIHYFRLVVFMGPVLALGLSALAVLLFAVLTIIAVVKR